MKRFLVFLVVAIAVTSLGLSIYYFSKDNEVIFINNTQISVNAGDTFKTDSLLTFQNASKYTKVDYDGVQDEEVLSYNKEEGFYAAVKGGETKIVITTNNRAYSNLVVNVVVRDGSEAYPYIIDSEEELRAIGTAARSTFGTSTHYELGKSIILTKKWTPIPEFTGSINGAGFTISNLDISQYTQKEIDATKIDNEGTLTDSALTEEYKAYNTSLNTLTYAGLIGQLKTQEDGTMAKVTNLTLKNVNIDGAFAYIGAIAGLNEGEIRNCHVSTDSYIKLNYVEGKVDSETLVYNTIQSSLGAAEIGGIAGVSINFIRTIEGIERSFSPIIERCTSAARFEIHGASQVVGGIVGNLGNGIVTECAFDGFALEGTAGATFGGIIGKNVVLASPSTVIDNFAIVNTTATKPISSVGAIIYKNIACTDSDRPNRILGNYHAALRIHQEDETYTTQDVVTIASGDLIEMTAETCKQLTAAQLTNKLSYETYRQVVGGSDYVRTWDFENVWTMGTSYPTINRNSLAGSVYQIDYSSIKGSNTLTQSNGAQEIYDLLKTNPTGSYHIAGDIDMTGVVWTPISSFSGTLTGGVEEGDGKVRKPVISNITILLPEANANQGLFKELTSSAIVRNITFSNVTIIADSTNTAQTARYVGVLAGENNGAAISDITINNVQVSGLTLVGFGGVVGYNDYFNANAISNVAVNNVTFSGSYAKVAGGIAAVNNATISGTEAMGAQGAVYVTANNINVVGNQVGGIVGCNYRTIRYAQASLAYSAVKTNTNIYGATDYIQVGGIAGYSKYTGLISNVKADATITVDTVKNYSAYLGGIVGYNAGTIHYAQTTTTNITSNYSYSVYAGGIAGLSSGVVYGSIVNSTEIKASTTTIEKSNESYVGGLVGRLTYSTTTMKAACISNSISKATALEGFYAGGIVGYSYGSVNRTYVEGTSIKGFFVGGLAAVINSVTTSGALLDSYDTGFKAGMFKYCYSIATLENINSTIDMSNLSQVDIYNSVASYDKGASAGIAVLVVYGAEVDNCYTVATFNGEGIKASTTISRECGSTDAAVHKEAYSGTIKNTIYTNKQTSIGTPSGNHVEESVLRPSEGMYKVFTDNGFDPVVWTAEIGTLPTIAGLYSMVALNNNIA